MARLIARVSRAFSDEGIEDLAQSIQARIDSGKATTLFILTGLTVFTGFVLVNAYLSYNKRLLEKALNARPGTFDD